MKEKRYRIVVDIRGAGPATVAAGVTRQKLYDAVVEAIETLAVPLRERSEDQERRSEIERDVLVAKITARFFVNQAPMGTVNAFGAEVRIEGEPETEDSTGMITSRGAATFYRLSCQAYTAGLVGTAKFAERLEWLDACTVLPHVRQTVVLAKNSVVGGEEVFQDEIGLEERRCDCLNSDGKRPSNIDGELLFWSPSKSGILSDFKFILGDPDPLPSVPHGHLLTRHARKLDAYLGLISEHGRSVGKRLSKNDLAALWNDESFRRFASKELRHFISSNSSHRRFFEKRGVKNPLRLPRMRRR